MFSVISETRAVRNYGGLKYLHNFVAWKRGYIRKVALSFWILNKSAPNFTVDIFLMFSTKLKHIEALSDHVTSFSGKRGYYYKTRLNTNVFC